MGAEKSLQLCVSQDMKLVQGQLWEHYTKTHDTNNYCMCYFSYVLKDVAHLIKRQHANQHNKNATGKTLSQDTKTRGIGENRSY